MSEAPSISFSKSHLGSSLIDGKTPVSFAVGMLAGMSGLNASWATVCVIGFEAFVVTLDEGVSAAFEKRSPQSYGNQMIDVMVGIAGVHVGENLKKNQETRGYQPPLPSSPPGLPKLASKPKSGGGITSDMIAASNQGQEAVNTQVPTTSVVPATQADAPLTGVNRVQWRR